MKEWEEYSEQEKEQFIKFLKELGGDELVEWFNRHNNNAKVVTLQELRVLGTANPNYTFSYTPDETPGYYENYKIYGDNDGSYIYGDVIDFCNGEVIKCCGCYINFFDENDNYPESYRLFPTKDELDFMYEESVGMSFDL